MSAVYHNFKYVLQVIKFISVIIFLQTLLMPLSAQDEKPKKPPTDTIVRLGGKKISCKISNVGPTKISYVSTLTGEKVEIERKNVEKIKYINGSVDVFNAPIVMEVQEDSWQAVVVTDDRTMVEYMFERGRVESESAASSRSVKAAKQSAQIKLQKKGAALGANVILLTKVEAKGGFGDFPAYYMEGVAYSFDAPPTKEDKKK